ncbi:hypothetical protein [Candidatus Poriferisocius sp.]|uniref:hypothetical protein n=1 Tax=Candidatus Poriferisocius sp. TaxID=3101276 RepID=UPI003B02E899
MPTTDRDIDDIFAGEAGSQSKQEIDALAERLQGVLSADIRRIYEPGVSPPTPIPPDQWSDNEANAITALTTNHKTGMFNVKWVDKARVSEQLARLKGLHRNEDVVDNPLREALRGLPRDELLVLKEHLDLMAKAG